MQLKILTVRSSHQRCSVKKGVLRNFSKFTGKHLCQCLFLNKVAGTFFTERLWATASVLAKYLTSVAAPLIIHVEFTIF